MPPGENVSVPSTDLTQSPTPSPEPRTRTNSGLFWGFRTQLISTSCTSCQNVPDEVEILFSLSLGPCSNDSIFTGKLGCHLDRHENIGRGHLGLSTFTRIMNDKLLDNIPMIIETPPGLSDKEEIDILYSLVNAV